MSKPTIVICSSAAFYEHVNAVAAELEAAGFEVVVPKTAAKMRLSGDYDLAKVKTWYDNPADYDKKAELMRGHFEKIAAGDSILVVNDVKNGQQSYIGPNALMEMGLAFYLHKPIYILNSVPEDLPIYEEVLGMGSVILGGNLHKLVAKKE